MCSIHHILLSHMKMNTAYVYLLMGYHAPAHSKKDEYLLLSKSGESFQSRMWL